MQSTGIRKPNIKILFGIQARSTSTRLPDKSRLMIGDKPMIQHVLSAADNAGEHLLGNKHVNIETTTALLIPKGDRLIEDYRGRYEIIEGDEANVLSRYELAYNKFNPDYLVRLTGDCPLIPPYIISSHVREAIRKRIDYVNNVDEDFRTDPDGWDCEVLSKTAMSYLFDEKLTEEEREHVTLALRKRWPKWLSMQVIVGFIDLYHPFKENHLTKVSVDTEEDLERVRYQYSLIGKNINAARRFYKIVSRM